MQVDFYDYKVLTMALMMCLPIMLAVHLYYKEAPRYIREPNAYIHIQNCK